VFGDRSTSVRNAKNRSTGSIGAPSSPSTVHDSRRDAGITTCETIIEPPGQPPAGPRQITTSTRQNRGTRPLVSYVQDNLDPAPDND